MIKLCDKSGCLSVAVWLYAPSPVRGCFCEEHVPRICSCNYNEDIEEYDKDPQGRDLPCVEYDYYECGFNTDEWGDTFKNQDEIDSRINEAISSRKRLTTEQLEIVTADKGINEYSGSLTDDLPDE